MSGYVYDSAWSEERRRLAGLEATFDAFTAAAFNRVGVQPGWRCLDIGAGGGSVARDLADRGASVVATDLETQHLEGLDDPRIVVRRHELFVDEIEPASFDLVHSRMVLEHLPQRDLGFRRMLDAVKPGGWLVIEDIGVTAAALTGVAVVRPASASEAFGAYWRAIFSVMANAGFDGTFAHRLPMTMMEQGLEDVECELRSKLMRGASTELPLSDTAPSAAPRTPARGLVGLQQIPRGPTH
jgi:SAM-dependent methyltransferase